ncbi:MAG: nucleotide sugar dehydrogenase [Micromonosporaceae bacterium]
MAEHQLSLAINGRERQLHGKLVAFEVPTETTGIGSGNSRRAGMSSVAVVGLGYVGLPTALALHSRCSRIIGIDISQRRLRDISSREADLTESDRQRLAAALVDGTLELTGDVGRTADADAVIICVPTPVDADHLPDLAALRSACATVVTHARRGQTIILTSTTFVGTTRELIVSPLADRGMRVGTDVFVAFSPERIDPGNPDHIQWETPRVVGGVTAECSSRAARVISSLTDVVYLVSTPEAAEATKLYENVFRAVTLALANEFADVCSALGLDPIEVTLAAGTKPYGFLGAFPGPGVGGHCIPCDPYYLLWQLDRRGKAAPLIEQAMKSISLRPLRVVERAAEVLAAADRDLAGARVIVAGVSYKAGVRDLRESPALPIIAGLTRRGAHVAYYDPLVSSVRLADGQVLETERAPRGVEWDLTIVHTVHPGIDYSWAHDCPRVLDATYQFDGASHRAVV